MSEVFFCSLCTFVLVAAASRENCADKIVRAEFQLKGISDPISQRELLVCLAELIHFSRVSRKTRCAVVLQIMLMAFGQGCPQTVLTILPNPPFCLFLSRVDFVPLLPYLSRV
jgi:hypothetical protein